MEYILNTSNSTPMSTNYNMYNTANATIPSVEMSTLSSIYIPRVYANISTEFVADTFERLNLGLVERVEVVPRPGDKTTYMAFVYFTSWNTDNKSAVNIAIRINTPDGPQARIVYDDPWYWILLPNNSAKPSKDKDTLTKHEAETENKVDKIIFDMIEDLQIRLNISEEKNRKNEKKIHGLQKELYDVKTILMMTGEQRIEHDVVGSNHDEEETFHIMPCSPPKLIRQTAGYWSRESTDMINDKIVDDAENGMITHRPLLDFPPHRRHRQISAPDFVIPRDIEALEEPRETTSKDNAHNEDVVGRPSLLLTGCEEQDKTECRRALPKTSLNAYIRKDE